MNFFLSWFLLALAMNIQFVANAGLTYRFDNTTQTLLLKETGPMCTSGNQIICHDCHKSIFCISYGDSGDFIAEPLEECSEGKICLPDQGCTTEKDPNLKCEATPIQFPCNNLGMFPDPLDCGKYHFCVPKDSDSKKTREFSYEAECDQGWAYDFTKNLCSIKLKDVINCQLYIKCKKTGDNGPVPNLQIDRNTQLTQPQELTGYFFICKKHPKTGDLFPNLYRCPHGENYSNGNCVKKIENDNTGHIHRSVFVCNEGVGNFQHESDCHSYYQCIQKADGCFPEMKTCRRGSYYDREKRQCVRGDC